MTIELALCLICALLAAKVSKPIAIHYLIFALANSIMLGRESADSSILAMFFAALAVADCLIVLYSSRYVLLASALASAALCLESVANGDWLLNHITLISVTVNAVILVSLAREYLIWMNGRSGQ